MSCPSVPCQDSQLRGVQIAVCICVRGLTGNGRSDIVRNINPSKILGFERGKRNEAVNQRKIWSAGIDRPGSLQRGIRSIHRKHCCEAEDFGKLSGAAHGEAQEGRAGSQHTGRRRRLQAGAPGRGNICGRHSTCPGGKPGSRGVRRTEVRQRMRGRGCVRDEICLAED